MGERKVLNKYYPPDFDPAKLPKLEIPKDRQYVVRLMAPFTMRCLTCGNYIYKGKKFNSRKETAIGEKYLGIQIYRFYIRCPQCLSEISFKTDPQNTDYVVDNGAYRTFQAERIAEMEEERVIQEKEEEEASNPMLALENRTKESRREMDVLDALEEIRDFNARNAQVKFEELMKKHIETEAKEVEEAEKVDNQLVEKIFSKHQESIKRIDEVKITLPPSKKPRVSDSNLSLKSKLSGIIVTKSIKKPEPALSLLSEYNSSSSSDNEN